MTGPIASMRCDGSDRGPDEDRVVLNAALGQGHKSAVGVTAIQLNAACIAGDADDLDRWAHREKLALAVELSVCAQTKAAADRVLIGPE